MELKFSKYQQVYKNFYLLISKYNDTITVAKVKETYSIFSQAEKRWEDDNECVGDVAGCLTNYKSFDYKFVQDLIKYMNVQDTAYLGQNKSNKIWLADIPSKALNGQNSQWHGVHKINDYFSHILLSNGVSIACTVENYRTCLNCYMDINAQNKPNRIGVDVFPFAVGAYKNGYYKGINPYYCEDSSPGKDKGLCATRNGKICSPDDGRSPTAYILKHNKVFDIKKLGYPK